MAAGTARGKAAAADPRRAALGRRPPGGRRPRVRLHLGLWGLLAIASAVVLIGGAILFVDRPVSTWSHAVLHRPAWSKLLTKLAVLPDPVALVAVLAAGIYYLRNRRLTPAWRIALAAGAATILATVAVEALKMGFGRYWPETWVENNPSWIDTHQYGFVPFHGGAGYESFPSGHTTRITAPFAVLWQRVPRWRLVYLLPIVAVVAGLIAADYHFVSDCIAGVYLGVASAALVMAVLP